MTATSQTLEQLTDRCSQDLQTLGLSDAQIAALDAAQFTRQAAMAPTGWERQDLTQGARRATERAAGATLADVAAVLGYLPE